MADNTYQLTINNTIITVRPAELRGVGELFVCKVDGGEPFVARVYPSRPGFFIPGIGERRAPNGAVRLVPCDDSDPVTVYPDTPVEFGDVVHVEWAQPCHTDS